MKSNFHDGKFCLVFLDIGTVKNKNNNALNQMISICTHPVEREREKINVTISK